MILVTEHLLLVPFAPHLKHPLLDTYQTFTKDVERINEQLLKRCGVTKENLLSLHKLNL